MDEDARTAGQGRTGPMKIGPPSVRLAPHPAVASGRGNKRDVRGSTGDEQGDPLGHAAGDRPRSSLPSGTSFQKGALGPGRRRFY